MENRTPLLSLRNPRVSAFLLSASLFSAAIIGAAGIAGAPSICRASDPPADLTTVLEEVRTRTGIPGIAAAVARDGELVAVGAAGVRAIGQPAPVTADDRFLIGSCAKAMLRVLIGRLVDTGLLSMDTTLGQVLSDMPMRDDYRAVTVGQILNHRGGIPAYTRIGPRMTPWIFELQGTSVEQRAAFAAHVLNEEPAAPPGTQEVYSNAGYGIVACVAERLAGKPWEELVKEQVFLPLGMSSAMVGYPTTAEKQDGPRGHFRTDTGYELTPGWHDPLPPFAPAGMISCTIEDFARFNGKLAMIAEGKPGDFLKKETAAAVAALTPGGTGMEGVPFLGGEGTFTAAFALWPSRGLAIVVQTNGGGSDDVCESAIEAVRRKIAPDAAAFVPPFNRNPHGVTFDEKNQDDWEVAGVTPGGPAEKAGLAQGDRLTKINGTPIEQMDLRARVDALRAGRVSLTVRRGDRDVDVELGSAGK